MSENAERGEPRAGLDRMRAAFAASGQFAEWVQRGRSSRKDVAPEDAEPGVRRMSAAFAAAERVKRDG